MKKIIYSIAAIALVTIFISCSSSASEQMLSADSTAVDSTVSSVDSIVTAVSNDTTVVADTLTK